MYIKIGDTAVLQPRLQVTDRIMKIQLARERGHYCFEPVSATAQLFQILRSCNARQETNNTRRDRAGHVHMRTKTAVFFFFVK